jgi:hypothetical protein
MIIEILSFLRLGKPIIRVLILIVNFLERLEDDYIRVLEYRERENE